MGMLCCGCNTVDETSSGEVLGLGKGDHRTDDHRTGDGRGGGRQPDDSRIDDETARLIRGGTAGIGVNSTASEYSSFSADCAAGFDSTHGAVDEHEPGEHEPERLVSRRILCGIFGKFSDMLATGRDIHALSASPACRNRFHVAVKFVHERWVCYEAIVHDPRWSAGTCESRNSRNLCSFLASARYNARRSGRTVYLVKHGENGVADLDYESKICKNLNMELPAVILPARVGTGA